MPTLHRNINGVDCNSSDWTNCLRSTSANEEKLHEVIQTILEHPMKDCVSLPFLFSYHYGQLFKDDVPAARYRAAVRVLAALNKLQYW